MSAPASVPPSHSRAQILADALLLNIGSAEREPFRTEDYEMARQEAYIADVEGVVLRFDRMVRIVTNLEPKLSPNLQVWRDGQGHIVPVDITDAILDSLAIGGGIENPIDYRRSVYDIHQNDPANSNAFGSDRFGEEPMETAIEAFRQGLVEFLGVRLDSDSEEDPSISGSGSSQPPEPGTRGWARSIDTTASSSSARAFANKPGIPRSLGAAARKNVQISKAPYLPFKVETRTSGIDVEQAPAYFLSWTFFGGPTTPTNGWILPGLYLFRSRDHTGRYRYDSTKFKIPPTQSASTIL